MDIIPKKTTSNRRWTMLPLVALAVLLIVGGTVIGSSQNQKTNSWTRDTQEFSVAKEQSGAGRKSFFNLGKKWSKNEIATSSDGWGTSQTGVYYVPGDPSKCFIITASPHGAQRGWILEPADALASRMISAFGWVSAPNPYRGKVMVWNDKKVRKQVKFAFFGGSIIIDGATYWRRPTKAPWTCTTGFTTKTAYYAKSFGPTNCQWLVWNKKTGGFVIYYSKGPGNIVAGGGGYLNAATGTGEVGGFHHSGALDGIYRVTTQASPPALLLWLGAGRFAGGAWDFIQIGTCVDPGYPKVAQLVGPAPPTTTTAQPQGPQTGAVSQPQCAMGPSTCANGQMSTTCTQTKKCCTSQTIQQSPKTYFSTCSGQVRGIFGSGWTLVRRVGPSHKKWHPATDQLAGTSVYGTPGTSDVADSTFSVNFQHSSYNQFLFMTGDCANWVLASRASVLSGWYANAQRKVCASSLSPWQVSQPRWYHRPGVLEDPWVSVIDHGWAVNMGLIVYGGRNWGLPHSKEITPRNGANVYIRAKSSLNANGC